MAQKYHLARIKVPDVGTHLRVYIAHAPPSNVHFGVKFDVIQSQTCSSGVY